MRPTSGAPTVAQKMGWTGTMRTRPWTGTPRACGARISSRAFRRPSPSTLPAAGGKSSCQMRERCTVSTLGNSQSNKLHEKSVEKPSVLQRFVAKRQQTSTIEPRKEMSEILFFFLCSCHRFDTEVNVLFPHKALFNKSVPVVL